MEKATNGRFHYKTDQIVVIGTSVGDLDTLTSLIQQLPKDFLVPVLIVMHISPDATGDVLNKHGKLICARCTW